jgi:hypothetical protein
MTRLFPQAFLFPVLGLALASAPAHALAQEWRFCVGVAPAAHEAVITDVFASSAESAQLEHRFEAYFRARKNRALTFQCPRGASERVDAMNAQTAALQFNRQMGFSVSSLPSPEVAAAAGPDQ